MSVYKSHKRVVKIVNQAKWVKTFLTFSPVSFKFPHECFNNSCDLICLLCSQNSSLVLMKPLRGLQATLPSLQGALIAVSLFLQLIAELKALLAS